MKVLVIQDGNSANNKTVEVSDDSATVQQDAMILAGIPQEDVEFLLTHDWVERSTKGNVTTYVSDGPTVIVTIL